MQKNLKKLLALILAAVMTITAIPLSSFEAKAAGVSGYSAGAAVQWARDHWNDYDSIILGAGYWDDGGDCANFVSQCLYMGGLNMNNSWNTSGKWHYSSSSNASFINAHNLYSYLTSIGGQAIHNPSASQISIGDIIFYRTTSDGRMHHSAIVVDIVNGTPVVAAHSTSGTRYYGSSYTLGYSGDRIYLVKMYGSTCSVPNPRSFDVYVVSNCGAAGRRCFTEPSPYAGYNFTFSAGEYCHVDRVVYEYGLYFGHTYGYGANGWYEGWIHLDNYYYQRHVDSAPVSHAMGNWNVSSNATCTAQGTKKSVCSKCGYTETQKFGPNGHNWAAATCTNAQYCKTCGTKSGSALGHSWGNWTTTKPSTCTQNGTKTRTCNRCGKTENQNINMTNHTWGDWSVKTPAECLKSGVDNRFCKVCKLEQTRKSNALMHNYEVSETITSTCTNAGYDVYTCTNCGDSYHDSVDALGHVKELKIKDMQVGDTFDYGSYPQRKVTDSALIKELNSYEINWISYSYVSGTGSNTDGRMNTIIDMKYADITHNNEKYRAVTFSEYRPRYTGYQSSAENSFQDDNGYYANNVYWFKFDPLTWIVLNPADGLVLCESVIDSHEYNSFCKYVDGLYVGASNFIDLTAPADWRYSSIRYWLNAEFYNDAFNNAEKANIVKSNISTRIYSNDSDKIISEATNDDIFLLSLEEILNANHGFKATDIATANASRVASGTDYAKSQGLLVMSGNVVDWTLRCAEALPYSMYYSNYEGVVMGGTTYGARYGIRPAMKMNTSYVVKSGIVSAVDATCAEPGSTEKHLCARCDALLVASEVIPALGHSWGDDITKEPTCTEKGSTTHTCSRCGLTDTYEIDALGHSFDVTFDIPTCTETGNSTSVCSRCSYTEKDNSGWTPWTEDFTEEYFIENDIPSSMYEVKTQYRYRDKAYTTKTSNLPTESIAGWTLSDTVKTYGPWGETVGPVYSDPGKSDVRDSWSESYLSGFDTTTHYYYYRYTNDEGNYSNDIQSDRAPNYDEIDLTYELVMNSTIGGNSGAQGFRAYIENSNYNTPSGKYHTYWFKDKDNVEDKTKPIYNTRWFYKDRTVSYIHTFWKWDNWSEWSTVKPEEKDNREIEIQTVSRINLEAFGHECNEDWVLTKVPTCSQEGMETAKCIRHDDGVTCDKTYTRPVNMLPHDLVKTEATDVTCLVDGNSEYYTCVQCEKYFADEKAETEIEKDSWIITALGHNDGQWICIDEGYEDFIGYSKEDCDTLVPKCGYALHFELHCTRCNNEEVCNEVLDEYEIVATDHNMVQSEYKEPSCVEGGYIVNKCTKCDYTESYLTEATEHNWSDWETIEEAYCVHVGYQESHCLNNCGAVEHNSIDAPYTEHNYVISETVSTECTSGTDLNHYICSRCGENDCDICETADNPHHYWDGNPTDHNIKQNDELSYAPTCTEFGLDVFECINEACEYSYTETVSPFGHDYQEYEKIPATCTESGKIHMVCTRNNEHEYMITDPDAPATGHDWSEWKTVIPATCTEDGLEKRICKNDASHVEENVLTAIGHNWDEGVIDPSSTCKEHGTKTYTCQNDSSHTYTEEVALDENNHVGETYIKDNKDATCTEDGYTGDTYCSDCDKLLEQGETISALTHDMGEWYTVTEATCTEKGLEKRECQRDNCKYSEERETAIDPDNHYAETFYTVDEKADCVNNGKKSHHCERCDVSLDEVVISKRDHAYDNGTETTAPTCTQDGVKTYSCTNTETEEYKACTHSYTEKIPALNHNWGEWETVTPATCEEDGLEKRICKNDANHVEETVLTAIGHNWDEGVIDPSSTCKDHGTKTYTCQNDTSHTYTEEVALDENNHVGETYIKDNKDATCTEDGYTGDTYCSDCNIKLADGEVVSATDHDWSEWETVKEPTYTEMGEEKRECSKCDAEETKYLPVLTRPSDENENIETEKTVEYDSATGEAVIKLLASSKGEKITVNSRTPLDIVLVLDQSGSMEGDLLKKLKTATENFTNAIYQDAVDNNIDHRIAMVGFAMQDQYNFGSEYPQYLNTEILTTGGDPIKYNSLSTSKMNEVYKNALVSVNVDGNLNPILTLAKNNLEAKGATAADLGLDMACQIFAQNENDGSRKRIVVFMTDGVPTYKSDYMEETATNANNKANLLKNAYEADLYSVGVLSGSGANTAKTFLNNIASKDANGKALYFDSANADKLVEDFKDIATQSTTTVTDFADITLIDTVSNAFTLTALQENKLRLDAIEKLGIINDDITVTRFADGKTEVKLEHIDPVAVPNGNDINYVIDFSFSVTANEKALIEGSYSTNTDNAGVIIGTNDVYENNFVVPSTNIENAEGVVYFTVNGITYHVVRVHKGESLDAPEFTLEGEYTFSGWDIPEEVIFDGGKLTVDATLTQTEYTVTWNTADGEIVDTYFAGDIIVVPEIGLNANGEEFLGWNSEVPAAMPGENLEFTASYGKHDHAYTENVLVKVSCGVTGKVKYTCSCGDSYTQTVEALEHKWSTSATSTDGSKTALSYVYCENCGDSPEKSLSYTVTGTSGWKQVTYDLKLVDANSITVQPDGSIKVSLPIPQNMKNASNVKIYREEADGTKTNLNGTVKNGYITFTTTHFSNYILEATYECDETGIHTDSDKDYICDICGTEIEKEEPSKNCSHMCHSNNGLVRFFWKIFNFFNRIFNIKSQRYCDCGIAHW